MELVVTQNGYLSPQFLDQMTQIIGKRVVIIYDDDFHNSDALMMALRHRELNVRGIQFHPESVLTPDGKKMLQNWLFL